LRLNEADTARVLDAALDAGVTLLDTADFYGDSEDFLGRLLGPRRSRVVLATKFGWHGNQTREDVREAVDKALRRLQTDRIDLMQVHKPSATVPIGETLAGLDEAVRAGKVREIGCSNFSVAQLREAEAAAGSGARFVSVQNDFSLLNREAEQDMLPECDRRGIAFLPFFPLANGLLTGKYGRGRERPTNTRLTTGPSAARLTEDAIDRADQLEAFAISRGHSLLELAVSWLLTFPSLASVIAGATAPEQVRANTAAASWEMSADDLAALSTLLARH
jgi:aryl-alcohol dehydrogenase-like predicted oxidoreductase